METTRNGIFVTAFLQGLVVVFFIYVVLLTVSVVKSRTSVTTDAQLASVTAEISRVTPAVSAPVPHLDPGDQAPAPVAEIPVAETPVVAPTTEETPAPEVAHTDPVATPGSPDLIEVTPQGPLPKRSASGQTPFDAYKKSYTPDGTPVIAIAVMNYGLSANDSREALKKLPPEVSLILNPYAQTPDVWKSLAGAEGHEFWVYLPVENQVYPVTQDPGPQALLTHSDFKYNQEKFLWALTRTSGYAGIAAYTDAAFLNAQSALKTLWSEGYNRGIASLEINPAGLEGIELNALEKNGPYIRNHSLYHEGGAQTPEQWLKALEIEAGNNGYAIGIIGTPYPKVVETINVWAQDLKTRGFSLAPVSAFAQVKSDAPATTPAVTPAPASDSHAPASHH
ncbi:MAG: divergent polysaccharide deacetylase family protein [Alphaproteobacteria bacterium]